MARLSGDLHSINFTSGTPRPTSETKSPGIAGHAVHDQRLPARRSTTSPCNYRLSLSRRPPLGKTAEEAGGPCVIKRLDAQNL